MFMLCNKPISIVYIVILILHFVPVFMSISDNGCLSKIITETQANISLRSLEWMSSISLQRYTVPLHMMCGTSADNLSIFV